MAGHGGDERWRWAEAGRAAPNPDDAAVPEAGEDGEESRAERERLAAARRYFRAAPPYCIRFEEDGRVSLRRKHLSPWGKTDPASATLWKLISTHADLEEAERRLRHITSPVAYYDARGRLVAGPPEPETGWGVPGEGED